MTKIKISVPDVSLSYSEASAQLFLMACLSFARLEEKLYLNAKAEDDQQQ